MNYSNSNATDRQMEVVATQTPIVGDSNNDTRTIPDFSTVQGPDGSGGQQTPVADNVSPRFPNTSQPGDGSDDGANAGGPNGSGGGQTNAGGGTGNGSGTGNNGGSNGGGSTGDSGGDGNHGPGGDGGGGVNLPGIGDILNPGESPIQVAGPDAPLQPILDATNTLVDNVNSELNILGQETGLSQIVHGATDLLETIGLGAIGTATPAADGHTNLLTDVLNAPGSILSGDLSGTISHVGADLSDVIQSVSDLKDAVIFGSDASNPVSDIIGGLGHALQTVPLLTVNGGNNASDGGLLGGIVGQLNGSSSGHLIDADVGPQQSNGLVLDLLSAPTAGPHHAAEVNAVDVGASGPHLLDLGLLTGAGGLNLPALGGTGLDSLVGGLPGSVAPTAGHSAGTPSSALPDLGLLHDFLPQLTDHGPLDLHGTHII